MQKKYGGSETLIGLLKGRSRHRHDIGYVQDSSQNSEEEFYIRTIRDFQDYFRLRVTQQKPSDIMHPHFVFGGIGSQDSGFRTVCSSHCLFSKEFKLAAHDTHDDQEKRKLFAAHEYFRRLERGFYPQIANLVVHSGFHKQEVERMGGKATMLELPMDVSKFKLGISKKDAKRAIGIPDKFTALFLGRPTYLKGFSVLADAFRDLSGRSACQLLVVGEFDVNDGHLTYTPCVGADGSTANRSSFFVGERLHVAPPTEYSRIPLYFAAADVLVCPSLYEAIGYVNLEAMAAGTPVVASNVAGIPFVVKDMQTGLLFEPGNSKDLGRKLEIIMDDPKLRENLTRNAMDFVQQYDIENVYPKYDALYDSVGAK
jgi:glycosyltransferase involved in cell wall biosynthesis